MTNVNKTIGERAATHGDYSRTAKTAQDLERLMAGVQSADPVIHESLDLIATKLARIVVGDPTCEDTWHDIAGYATLVEERLREARMLEAARREGLRDPRVRRLAGGILVLEYSL